MTDTTTSDGRRERKKARTRRTISQAALRLFLAHGFDAVTVSDIADEADVAVSTLFTHFPSKEAMAFPRDAELGAGFVTAVEARGHGTPILEALRDYVHIAPRLTADTGRDFVELVERTPALARHVDRIWSRHAEDLARAIERATGAPPGDTLTRAIARYVVEVPAIVRADPDRDAAIDAVFDLLARGWREPAAPPRAAAHDG